MQSRRGVILVVVLVVIVVLTLSVFAFSKFMMAQYRGTHTALRQTQVRLLAESGVEYLRIMLLKDQYTILELGGLYDNPDEFCGHIITDGTITMTGIGAGQQTTLGHVDLRDVGRFTVIAPALSEDGLLTGDGYIRYGLEDESTKLNLRWVLASDLQQPGYGRLILMRLPGVTEDIADSILDWIDGSSYEPREFGAKDEYYMSLDPPYFTRNGIPDSLDELLLVRGVTPKLLYGVDWNRNGVRDLGEPDEYTLDEFDVIDGSLNLGLITYLTLDSREPMTTPDGYQKINVNMEDLAELRTLLEEVEIFAENPDWIDYIVSYRQQAQQQPEQPSDANLGNILGSLLGSGGASDAATTNTDGKINSLLDLVGGTGSPFADDPDEINYYGPYLYDNLTISDTPIVGRININQASRTVLELFVQHDDELTDTTIAAAEISDALLGTTLTDMSAWEIIDGIIAWREMNPSYLIEYPEMNYPFWVYTHGIISDLAVMKQFEPYFCTQGAVFKATVVGRFDDKSPVCRLEVWLDAAEGRTPAKVIRIRDVSDLGPGYSAELLGADELYVR